MRQSCIAGVRLLQSVLLTSVRLTDILSMLGIVLRNGLRPVWLRLRLVPMLRLVVCVFRVAVV